MMGETRIRLLGAACVALVLLVGAWPSTAGAQSHPPVPNDKTVILPASPEICALLDDPEKRGVMDGLLFNLAFSCGREAELLGPGGRSGPLAPITSVNDAQVNDPLADVGHPSLTQSETSMAENPTTGTLCSGFNDSCEFFCPGGGGGFTGFARSTDDGQTWTDGGAIGATAFGDPSVVWREADGNFYLATLSSGGGLAFWSSTDDCRTFNFVSTPATSGDDKELLAVDNWPGSPNNGNIYLVWTDFGFSGRIRAIRSTDGGVTWSAPANLSAPGPVVQGAWPTVAPNGDVYVAWIRYTNFTSGPISIDVARSTDGGLTYSLVTSPLIDAVSPRDAAASSACGRPSLKGQIRYLASPQIVSDARGNLHIVYSYDPDGFNFGDVVDVFYRRSSDGAVTWGPEIRLNDDASSSDQYFPTIQVSDGRTLMATWYDRRLDGANLLQDYFKRVSTDNGFSWHPSVRLSDVSSPIILDPSLATCYHGDYDQSLIESDRRIQVTQWADDRSGNPDVWTESGNAFQGRGNGDWVIPQGGDEAFSGTLFGGSAGDPAVYDLAGTATPGGTVSGTLTGVDPSTPTLDFSGTWQLDGGSTTSGTFEAVITGGATPGVSGRVFGRFEQASPPTPGTFRGRWRLSTR